MNKTHKFDWQNEAKTYFSCTPKPKKWFEIIGWITALSTLKVFSEKTNSFYVLVLYIISYAVLFNSLQKFFYTREFQKFLPNKFNNRLKSILSYLLSLVTSLVVYFYISKVSQEIATVLKI